MTENKEVPNEFLEEQIANAEQTTPANAGDGPIAKAPINVETHDQQGGITAGEVVADPSAVHEAVKAALDVTAPPKIELLPCACGAPEVNLVIDAPRQGEKVGRVSCSDCGAWGVDFLVPRTQDQELIGKKAAQAWNEAPRG